VFSLQQYLTSNIPNAGIIIIPSKVINDIKNYKQTKTFQKENGGIFLGQQRGNNIEIIEATPPQKGDQNGRFFFHRASLIHQNIATNRWKNSNFTITYCGEWHTHPEKIPKPSIQDLTEWRKKLNHYKIPLLLVIIGIEKNWTGLFINKNVNKIQLQ